VRPSGYGNRKAPAALATAPRTGHTSRAERAAAAMLTRRTMLATSAAMAAAPAVAHGRHRAEMGAVRALHNQLVCLDTHLDTPANFARPGWDIMQRHSAAEFSQVDYPRMVEGGLDGGFFAIYTAQGPLTPEGMSAARDAALLRAAAIREMVARHGDHFVLAFAPADAARIAAQNKRIVYQSIENSYPLGNDVTLLRSFYALGVRLAGPIHFKDNQFGDSATDKSRTFKGLSPLGRDWLVLCNELGIVPDASHSSDDVFDQMVADHAVAFGLPRRARPSAQPRRCKAEVAGRLRRHDPDQLAQFLSRDHARQSRA
jgi:membrane dipeptidase